jgi:transposase-like protein
LTDDPDFVRFIVERVIQVLREAAAAQRAPAAHLHADPHERTATRTGYRDGDKPRQRNTRVGTLTLQAPQDRDGTFSTQLFARDQRSETALVLAPMEIYYECVRHDGHIVRQGVVIVTGVRADGQREMLGVTVADTESAATGQEVFRDRMGRGLSGVLLVTSDACKGLKAAIDRHCQGASWQRRQVHVSRDLLGMVGAGRRGEPAAGCPLGSMREIFAATTRELALPMAEAIAARWEPNHPVVARALEEGIEDCLACLIFPLAHRPRIRTTNGLERLNEEIKRRARVVPGALWADSRILRAGYAW